MAELAGDIRGVTIPVTGGKVLLPNASVAEVITYNPPEAIESAPDWVLGRLSWRGWRFPLFSYSLLTGIADEETTSGAKVAVIKALGGRRHMPFVAMLAQGFPRLTTLTPDNLHEEGAREELQRGVACVVSINDDAASVPDLSVIEDLLDEACPVA